MKLIPFYLILVLSSCFFYCSNINQLKNKEICLITFGDSITLGIGRGIGEKETYSYYLEKLLKESGKNIKILRSGISGETAEGALNRIGDIINKKPDYVTIMYGTNDAFIDTCYDEADISPRLPIEDYKRNIEKIVQLLLNKNIRPILMTPIIMGNFRCINYGIYKKKGINFKLKEYAGIIRKIAEKNNILLIDNFRLWENFKKNNVNIDKWLIDGIHPNKKGNLFIAKTIYKALIRQFKIK